MLTGAGVWLVRIYGLLWDSTIFIRRQFCNRSERALPFQRHRREARMPVFVGKPLCREYANPIFASFQAERTREIKSMSLSQEAYPGRAAT